jgi:hypothetical protein
MKETSMRVGLLIIAVWAVSFAFQARAAAPAPQEAPAPGFVSATIEDAIDAVDDGYRFEAYVVRWEGSRVLVSAPLSDGHLRAGDSIRLVVARYKSGGLSMLTFFSADGRSAAAADAPGAAPQPSTTDTEMESATLTVEEVLQAQENGYRQTAYIGQWNGLRVAVTADLARHAYTAGESLPVIVLHLAVNGARSLRFMVAPEPDAHPAPVAMPQYQHVQDSGIIEDVLDSQLEGVAYAAYIVEWNGARVAVPADQPPLHQVGESIQLTLTRLRLPAPASVDLLSFETDVPPPAASTAPLNVKSSTRQETGVVDSVLSAQDGLYRYRAYVVTWHGTRVVVQDGLATTRFKEGDTVGFSATKVGGIGVDHLSFTLYDFSGVLKRPDRKVSPAGQGSGT